MDGTFDKKLTLKSPKYLPPEFDKLSSISGMADEKSFFKSFSSFVGFYPFRDGYLTVLAQNETGLIELWDSQFQRLGSLSIPDEEAVVGTEGEQVIFFVTDDVSSKLIFRTVTKSQADR